MMQRISDEEIKESQEVLHTHFEGLKLVAQAQLEADQAELDELEIQYEKKRTQLQATQVMYEKMLAEATKAEREHIFAYLDKHNVGKWKSLKGTVDENKHCGLLLSDKDFEVLKQGIDDTLLSG